MRPLATITKRQRRELEICLTREWPQLYTGQYAVQDRTHDVYAGRAPARCCGRLHTYLEQNSLDLFSRRPANETTTCKPCGSWAKGTERRIKLVIFGASQGWQRVRFGIAADPHRAGTTGWAKKNSSPCCRSRTFPITYLHEASIGMAWEGRDKKQPNRLGRFRRRLVWLMSRTDSHRKARAQPNAGYSPRLGHLSED